MKIIIVGCGKVGETLAAVLSQEGNEITIIDKREDVVERVCNQYDVMGTVGDGVSYSTQVEADIAMRLSQKPYAVKKGLESTRSLSAKKLLDYLNQLAELDQGIKSGQIDPKDGFEQFVLRNGKRYAGY